ncbi:hypothetical protein [Piscinibacter gummiphilus]|uniref:Uncharacterized protein n=1 Tax=Piscinibacter gummiphilus TaxID=946333 RepID=A0A1W6LFJ0_9BURK|nr:hypothetical protein [Piscinibacter gummiphilus]ARN22990.1 hypothetical protein A4W93_25455 [Piscinibacter gummiphilus]ATU67690.1 hypothetical protein CPZ87_25590 [Piscinibacter gummiphilus]GLS96824.1 hypothetical protein GCM10007918_41160 [Piscinibacter gummiphilus]
MTRAIDPVTLKTAVVSVAVAALGAAAALVWLPGAAPATVVFFAVIAAIALFGATKAARVAWSLFRQLTR